LGIFELSMTYTNVTLFVGEGIFLDAYTSDSDLTGITISSGTGTLFYRDDALPDLSVDGEQPGDVIELRTPDCNLPGVDCPSTFFSWDEGEGILKSLTGNTGIDPVPTFFDELALGDPINNGLLSLFHGGQPCPAEPDTNLEQFYCDPDSIELFQAAGLGDTPEDFAAYQNARAFGIGVEATIVAQAPEPAIGALLGIGLAGVGFARRRGKGRDKR
jgi:hypothetical protein